MKQFYMFFGAITSICLYHRVGAQEVSDYSQLMKKIIVK